MPNLLYVYYPHLLREYILCYYRCFFFERYVFFIKLLGKRFLLFLLLLQLFAARYGDENAIKLLPDDTSSI